MTFTLDGHRSLAVEVQSLVTNSVLPTPRRAVNGVDPSRIAMLVAVLYRHGGISLLQNDLYISTIAGGQAKEPGMRPRHHRRNGERRVEQANRQERLRHRRDQSHRAGAAGATFGVPSP